MGNIFYWTVSLTNDNSREYYAVNTDDLSMVDSFEVERTKDLWDMTQEWLILISISFKSNSSSYIYPRLQFNGVKTLILSLLLSLITICIYRRVGVKELVFKIFVVLTTGIAGFIAILILPKFRNNN